MSRVFDGIEEELFDDYTFFSINVAYILPGKFCLQVVY